MKQFLKTPLVAFVLFTLTYPAFAGVTVGEKAPDFIGTDTHGITHNLDDYRGKTIILEWTNHECPFVKKHYGSGSMQSLQKEAVEQGIVWLSIVSSAPGRQGYTTAEEANSVIADTESHATERFLDPEGAIGHLYGARVTPHMFIINPDGTLAYDGAIDDMPGPNPKTLDKAHNYVRAALTDLSNGKPIRTAKTSPYGCAIKYKR